MPVSKIRERRLASDDNPEYGKAIADMFSMGLYNTFSNDPVDYDNFNPIVSQGLNLGQQGVKFASSLIPYAGPFIAPAVEATKATKSVVDSAKEGDTAGAIAAGLSGLQSAGSSIAMSKGLGDITGLTDNPSAIESTIKNQTMSPQDKFFMEQRSPTIIAEGGLFLEGKAPGRKPSLLKSDFYGYGGYPIKKKLAPTSYPMDISVTGTNENSYGVLADQGPMTRTNPFWDLNFDVMAGSGVMKRTDTKTTPAIESVSKDASFADRRKEVTDMATGLNVLSGVLEAGFLASRIGQDFTTSQRPETVDPIDPAIPYNAVRTMTNYQTDKILNTAIREARESGTTIPLGDVLDSQNKLNAQGGDYLAKLLMGVQETNTDIAFKNAALLSQFRRDVDNIKYQNQVRKDTIWGSLASTPNKFGQSIFQQKLDTINTEQFYENETNKGVI